MSVNYPFHVQPGRLCDPHRERSSTTIVARGHLSRLPLSDRRKGSETRKERERAIDVPCKMWDGEVGSCRDRRGEKRHDPMSCCCSCRRDATAVASVAVISRRTVFDVGLGTQVIAG